MLADPRKAPLQVGQHELQRLRPRLFMIALEFDGMFAVTVADFILVDSVRQFEMLVLRFNVTLELLQAIEEGNHGPVKL